MLGSPRYVKIWRRASIRSEPQLPYPLFLLFLLFLLFRFLLFLIYFFATDAVCSASHKFPVHLICTSKLTIVNCEWINPGLKLYPSPKRQQCGLPFSWVYSTRDIHIISRLTKRQPIRMRCRMHDGPRLQKAMIIPIMIHLVDVRRRSAGDWTVVVPISERLRFSVVHLHSPVTSSEHSDPSAGGSTDIINSNEPLSISLWRLVIS